MPSVSARAPLAALAGLVASLLARPASGQTKVGPLEVGPPVIEKPREVLGTPTAIPAEEQPALGKERLSEADLEEKREGSYFTGFPIANYDSNTGFGAGGSGFLYNNGKKIDPLFAYTPYRHRLYAVTFFTTGGAQFHTLDYDAPYLAGSKLRLRAAMTYERNINANYFGSDSRTLDDLSFPADPRRFDRNGEYEAAQALVQPSGETYAKYDKFQTDRPAFFMSVERDLFGGLVRPLLGFNLSHVNVTDFSGRVVDAVDPATGAPVKAPLARTRLRETCDRGEILGCTGGWDTTFKFGLAFDTRDFEPDPNRGWFVDLVAELGSKATGSSFSYGRVTFTPRVYWSPFPKLADVVVAARGVYSAQFGDVPFYSKNTLSFSQGNKDGLGGLRTLRGYRQDRFVGNVAVLANLELRWTFAHFRVASERFALIASPFLDMGRVFDRVDQLSFDRWKRTQGFALRVAWNQATLLGFDYGVSKEGSGLYVDFGFIF